MNFAERLAMLRKAKDVPLKEVAGYLRVSVATLSNYESGIHQPDFDIFVRLADYYGVSTDYLLGRGSCLVRESPHDKNALLALRERIYFETEGLSENNLLTLERLVRMMKEYEIYVDKEH